MSEEIFDITKIDRYMQFKQADENGLVWRDAMEAPFVLSGRYDFGQEKSYHRIPESKLAGLSSGIVRLAKCTAGEQLRFRSDTLRVTLGVSVPQCKQASCQAPAGQFGFDLYVDGIYWSCSRITDTSVPYVYEIYNTKSSGMHEFLLNFPLYNGVDCLRIGLDADAALEAPSPRSIARPVVIYGTSITQGGCASRPGMAFTNIISRKLNVDILNFGFSGVGQNEPQMAEILAEIKEPAMYIMDSEANSVSAALLNERVPVFLDILRNAHPTVPILVISKVKYGPRYASQIPVLKEDFRKIVEQKQKSGDRNIRFLDGSDFFGGEDEYYDCTTDGAHPNDLGFFRMAKGIAPVVKKLLCL